MTAGQHEVRIISIYATPWRYRPDNNNRATEPVESLLPLGALEDFHDLFRDQLPQVLACDLQEADSLELNLRNVPSGRGDTVVFRLASWLFVLPSDQVVSALDIEFFSPPLDEDVTPIVDVLQSCAFAQLTIAGATYEAHITDLARRSGVATSRDILKLPPERHQIVFASHTEGRPLPGEEQVKQILYRVEPPFRQEFMEIKEPSGLNQDECTRGVVTPYTSLLYGHPDYIENSVFLTTVQAVGTAARFRQIWHRAHGQVRDFRYNLQAEESGRQKKEDMERLVDELGNLELDLSFSVETSADLGLLIPSLRIESFHRELYAAMELHERANRVSRMFSRLDSSIKSELTAIEIRESKEEETRRNDEAKRQEQERREEETRRNDETRRREDERREEERKRLRSERAVSTLSFVGVPIGFLVTFFGINSSQVDSHWSIFSGQHYWGVYLFALALGMIPLLTFWFLRWWEARQARRAEQDAAGGLSPQEPLAATLPSLSHIPAHTAPDVLGSRRGANASAPPPRPAEGADTPGSRLVGTKEQRSRRWPGT